MPRLRTATWICIWIPPIEAVESDTSIVLETKDKGPAIPPPVIRPEEKEIFVLKTNLLYDAATALNAAVEYPIGKKFSIMAEDIFPWWNWGPNGNKYCFQLWEMGIEPRWWFKSESPLLGHFIGIYGKSAKYDFQNDTQFCYQGEYWSTGISYGYAMPIGNIFRLEFQLSAGYMHSDYRHYQPSENYDRLYQDKYKTGTFSYFGPTKVQVSLVLPINVSKGKR